jgi:hypothetical protein
MNLKKVKDSGDIAIREMVREWKRIFNEARSMEGDELEQAQNEMDDLKNRLQTEGYDVSRLDQYK